MPGLITSRLTTTYTDGTNGQLTATKVYDGDTQEAITISVPAGATALAIDFRMINTKAKAFYLIADQNLTVKVNSTTVPDKTVTVIAGAAITWDLDATVALHPFGTVAVVSLFVANATAVAATLNVRHLAIA